MTKALLRTKAVCERTGLSRVALWKLRKAGTFPQAVLIGERSIAWRVEDVEKWMSSRETVVVLAPPPCAA